MERSATAVGASTPCSSPVAPLFTAASKMLATFPFDAWVAAVETWKVAEAHHPPVATAAPDACCRTGEDRRRPDGLDDGDRMPTSYCDGDAQIDEEDEDAPIEGDDALPCGAELTAPDPVSAIIAIQLLFFRSMLHVWSVPREPSALGTDAALRVKGGQEIDVGTKSRRRRRLLRSELKVVAARFKAVMKAAVAGAKEATAGEEGGGTGQRAG